MQWAPALPGSSDQSQFQRFPNSGLPVVNVIFYISLWYLRSNYLLIHYWNQNTTALCFYWQFLGLPDAVATFLLPWFLGYYDWCFGGRIQFVGMVRAEFWFPDVSSLNMRVPVISLTVQVCAHLTGVKEGSVPCTWTGSRFWIWICGTEIYVSSFFKGMRPILNFCSKFGTRNSKTPIKELQP